MARVTASCPTFSSASRGRTSAARCDVPEGRADLARAPCVVAMKIGRRRRDGRVPQVVPHTDELHAKFQRMGGMGVPHPVGTGTQQFFRESGVVVLNERGRLHKRSVASPAAGAWP
jgi:hypothetical protein